MDETELKRLEALCERYATGPADGTQSEMRHQFTEALPAALAEIRKMRAALEAVRESSDWADHCSDSPQGDLLESYARRLVEEALGSERWTPAEVTIAVRNGKVR